MIKAKCPTIITKVRLCMQLNSIVVLYGDAFQITLPISNVYILQCRIVSENKSAVLSIHNVVVRCSVSFTRIRLRQ